MTTAEELYIKLKKLDDHSYRNGFRPQLSRRIQNRQDILATGEYLLKQQGGNRRSKISPEIKQEIFRWVDNNCLLRLKDIRAKLIEVHDLEVSISKIDRCLREFHYTVKKTTLVPARRNFESTIEERVSYAINFQSFQESVPDKSLIFIDEVGFSVSTRPKGGRSVAFSWPRW